MSSFDVNSKEFLKELENKRTELENKRTELENAGKEIEKKLLEACSQAKVSAENYQKTLNDTIDVSIKKLILDTSQVIETKSITDQKLLYRTTISALGSSTNEFPTQPPSSEDIYWKTHKEQVDNALSMRKELLLKIIEIASNTVSGLVGLVSPAK